MKVAVISDTHGYLDPAVVEMFKGVDHILHAGDVGADSVLESLGALAPVTAVLGNVDRGTLATRIRSVEIVELAGRLVVIAHQRPSWDAVQAWCRPRLPDVVVYGHSHRPSADRKSGVLHLNPGSAGHKRFSLPRSVAFLNLGAVVEPRIVILEDA